MPDRVVTNPTINPPYRTLIGTRADLVRVLDPDKKEDSQPAVVQARPLSGMSTKIQYAREDMRASHLPSLSSRGQAYDHCDLSGLGRNWGYTNV